jgi:hypothetical protein
MAGLAFDLRESVGAVGRHRSVALLSLACLGLGIGTSGAMLGLLDALWFRPPAHVATPGELKRVYITDRFPGVGEFTTSTTSSDSQGFGEGPVVLRGSILCD